jgi:hypothetical protein
VKKQLANSNWQLAKPGNKAKSSGANQQELSRITLKFDRKSFRQRAIAEGTAKQKSPPLINSDLTDLH